MIAVTWFHRSRWTRTEYILIPCRVFAAEDPTNPLVSPLMGDFAGLPPLHICVGTHEIHLDDCVNVAERAEQHGVDVTLSKWPRMVHAFPIMSPLFPEAKRALAEICAFIGSHVDG